MEDQEVMSIAAVEDWFAKKFKSVEPQGELMDAWIGISVELDNRQKEIDQLKKDYKQLADSVIASCNSIIIGLTLETRP